MVGQGLFGEGWALFGFDEPEQLIQPAVGIRPGNQGQVGDGLRGEVEQCPDAFISGGDPALCGLHQGEFLKHPPVTLGFSFSGKDNIGGTHEQRSAFPYQPSQGTE